MIRLPKEFDPHAAIVVINIGNTSTRLARWHDDRTSGLVSAKTGDSSSFREVFDALARSFPDGRPAAAVVASVVPTFLDEIGTYLEEQLEKVPLVVGTQVERPIDIEFEDKQSVGMDRICCAAAAYDRLQHQCAVVDFGTAVTVDLISDEGSFVGGAILPGLRLQLESLHRGAALLPSLDPAIPEDPVGQSTVQAMQSGVGHGLAGAVRGLVEAYATKLNHWPHVVATGGDVVLMAPHCDFLDNIVPDLCLRGVGLAYNKRLQAMGL